MIINKWWFNYYYNVKVFILEFEVDFMEVDLLGL